MIRIRSKIFLLLIVAVFAAPMASAMSEKKEKELGKELYNEILATMPIYQDPKLVEYVNKVGKRVARVSDRPNYDFTFTIIDSPDINAFATPGGYIYVNRGLLTYLNSEAQLAAVLSHEIGHVTAEHAARQKRASTTNKVVAGILGVLTGSGDVAEASALWGATMVSGYGRDMELEADQLGGQFLYRAGYPPKAMMEVISILKDTERVAKRRARDTGKDTQSYHGLFASHPKNDKRLQEIIASAGQLPEQISPEQNVVPFRMATNKLPWGEHFQAPARTKNRLYHNRLYFSLDYPEGWTFKEQGNTIIGGSPAGADQKLQLTLSFMKRTTEPPATYIKKRLGILVLKQPESFSPARLAGHRGIVQGKDGAPQVRLAVIYYGRLAYVFQGEILEGSDIEAADQKFLSMIDSFRPLPKPSRNAAKQKYTQYVKAKSDTTFAKLAKFLNLGKYGEDELRLINNYYPIGEPEPGEWIKIIR